MTRRHVISVLLLPVILVSMGACNGGGSDGPTGPGRDRAAERRIVIMAPAAAEMLEALGALNLVVGVGDFVERPVALTRLPRIGAYNAPNVEQILSLEADLMITADSQAAAPAHDRLAGLGVEVLALDTSTYAGVLDAVGDVGRTLGRESSARDLVRSIERRMAGIRERSAGLERRRVLFTVGRDPLYVAGPGSHIDEMITAVGGTNVAADALSPYQQVSMEAALERMPEVIVDTSDNRPTALRGRDAGPWAQWAFLPAVERRRVYFVAPERLVIPGIRLPEMTERMGRLIHPETFGEPGVDDFAAPADP